MIADPDADLLSDAKAISEGPGQFLLSLGLCDDDREVLVQSKCEWVFVQFFLVENHSLVECDVDYCIRAGNMQGPGKGFGSSRGGCRGSSKEIFKAIY